MDLFENDCPKGIYNIVNSGYASTEQVAQLMTKYNIKDNFSFFESEEEFYRLGAKAPRSNCLLDNSKLLSAGVKIRDVSEALEDSLRKWT